ncbi:hypothetical protein ABH899_001975 [Paenibacillus sp. RC84]
MTRQTKWRIALAAGVSGAVLILGGIAQWTGW